MSAFLPALARWLHAVSLSLWLGGLVAIGALTAPVAFHALRGSSLLTLAQANSLAGRIVGDSLFFFNILCCVCGGFLLLANFLLLRPQNRRWAVGCFSVSVLLLVSTLSLFLLTPAMNAARLGGDLTTFDRLHHLYEQISTLGQLPLLLLLAWFGALRDGTHATGVDSGGVD